MLRIPGDPRTSGPVLLVGRGVALPVVEEPVLGVPPPLPGAQGLGRGSLFSVPCCWLVEESKQEVKSCVSH